MRSRSEVLAIIDYCYLSSKMRLCGEYLRSDLTSTEILERLGDAKRAADAKHTECGVAVLPTVLRQVRAS